MADVVVVDDSQFMRVQISKILEDGGRRLTLHIHSARAAPVMEVTVESGEALRQAWVDGESLAVDGEFRLSYHAVPAAGFELELELAGGGPVSVAAVDGSFGLPALAPARPAKVRPRREPRTFHARKFPVSDVTLVRVEQQVVP
jgi:CheY-like chemotaxis protein